MKEVAASGRFIEPQRQSAMRAIEADQGKGGS
jgi:hypothetical protein